MEVDLQRRDDDAWKKQNAAKTANRKQGVGNTLVLLYSQQHMFVDEAEQGECALTLAAAARPAQNTSQQPPQPPT